ncbi:hypothetical protein IFM89_005357 [Coptis chinensis]|uniref:PRC-barrel domain-containing protein n=1 Tax=Coptis chinensis TaxID=261450 RepID=A0A835LQJ0_9MAGN|nr:hypothetical protein IFM89_005357 [Coptis chinensis]
MCNCISSSVLVPLSSSYRGTIVGAGFQVRFHNTTLFPTPKVTNNKSDNFELSKELNFKEIEADKSKNEAFDDLVKLDDDKEVKSQEEIVGKRELLRKGIRQVIRRSNMIAKQVVCIQSALSLGFVSQLWVDTGLWEVVAVEVRPSMLSGEIERFLLQDVCQIGDVVLVEDERVLEEQIRMMGLDTLVGYNVVTQSRRKIGKVRGFTFNINSGVVELLELDSFGISFIPSSLVSTYALFVEDVIDVESDTVVVHEVAVSRVQRLTKGFWDTPNAGTSTDKLEEYSDFERGSVQSNSRRNSRKLATELRETEDDWQLPMDYL